MKKVIISSLLIASLPVLAHEGMHGPSATFDKDSDGTLSPQEFTAFLNASKEDASQAESQFKALDRNGDGKLSSGEMARWKSSKPAS